MKYKGREYIEITPDGTMAGAAAQEPELGRAFPLRAGIDVGSTTVKLAILDEDDRVVWSIYERHHSDVRATIAKVLEAAADAGRDSSMFIGDHSPVEKVKISGHVNEGPVGHELEEERDERHAG